MVRKVSERMRNKKWAEHREIEKAKRKREGVKLLTYEIEKKVSQLAKGLSR